MAQSGAGKFQSGKCWALARSRCETNHPRRTKPGDTVGRKALRGYVTLRGELNSTVLGVKLLRGFTQRGLCARVACVLVCARACVLELEQQFYGPDQQVYELEQQFYGLEEQCRVLEQQFSWPEETAKTIPWQSDRLQVPPDAHGSNQKQKNTLFTF